MLGAALEFPPERTGPAPAREKLRSRQSVRDVLMTVPHGAAGNDVLASDVGAAMLRQLLNDGFDAALLVSRTCRYSLVDMNRAAARGTPFRRAVARCVAERPRLLIDVHSFPNSYGPYSGNDVVLLHEPGTTDLDFLRAYATRLLLAAATMGRKASVALRSSETLPKEGGATPRLDILDEARELGHPAGALMLAEHNEASNPAMLGEMHRRAIRALAKDRGWFDGILRGAAS